jgi:hypothetical protein
VFARAHRLGPVEALFVEPESGAAAFVSVSVGGILNIGDSTFVIPWGAVTPLTAAGKTRLEIDKEREAMASAPTLKTHTDLARAEFRQAVHDFYGVGRPAYERFDVSKRR